MKRLLVWLHDLPEKLSWWLLVRLLHRWCNRHMDQWEKFAFDGKFGRVYVTMSYATDHREAFILVDENGDPRQVLPSEEHV